MSKGRETRANFAKATSEQDLCENKVKWKKAGKIIPLKNPRRTRAAVPSEDVSGVERLITFGSR